MLLERRNSSDKNGRPLNRGKQNKIELDLRPATPASAIKFTTVGSFGELHTKQNRGRYKTNNSQSLSPLKNILTSPINMLKLGDFSENTRTRPNESTQGSLNLDAYFMNNSTLTIEEVDEEENREQILLPKIKIPKILPILNHSPKLPDILKNNENTLNVIFELYFSHYTFINKNSYSYECFFRFRIIYHIYFFF